MKKATRIKVRISLVQHLKSADEMTDKTTGHLTGGPVSQSTRSPDNGDRVVGRRRASHTHRAIGYSLVCLLCLLLPVSAWAEGAVGNITHLSGVLFAARADGTKKMLSVKSEILEGDTLKTEVDTYARIKFTDGGEVVLRPETVFKVESYGYNASTKEQDNLLMSLLKGGLRSVTGMIGKRNPDGFQMKTATATIGIRGTHFGALLCNNDCVNIPTVSGQPPGDGLHTDTAQGTTIVSNAAGSIEVPAGSFSYTPSPTAPPMLVPPSQGIQITMPTSISSNKATGSGVGSSDSNACTVK